MRVMTYNIKNATPTKVAAYEWVNRKETVAKIILEAGADVLGLQEMTDIQVADLTELLPGYTIFGAIRSDEEFSEHSSVVYRNDKLTLLDSDTFWLSDTPEVMSKTPSWNAGCYRVATWGKFTRKADGTKFIFICTHLDNVSALARQKGIHVIKDFILTQTLPVILVGDFNSEPIEPFYSDITDILDDAVLHSPDHVGILKTCSMLELEDPLDLAKMERIDYVFHSKSLVVERTETRMERREGKYPSDHFPVIVDFK